MANNLFNNCRQLVSVDQGRELAGNPSDESLEYNKHKHFENGQRHQLTTILFDKKIRNMVELSSRKKQKLAVDGHCNIMEDH